MTAQDTPKPATVKSSSHFVFEPNVWLQFVNAAIAVLIAFHLVHGMLGNSIATIATGVVALIVAILTRPWVVTALVGAGQTIVTGIALFAHITDTQQAAIIAVLTIFAAIFTRDRVSPASMITRSSNKATP